MNHYDSNYAANLERDDDRSLDQINADYEHDQRQAAIDEAAMKAPGLDVEAAAHTPGPWIVKGEGDTLCVTDRHSAYIVDRFILGGRSREERKANATLIAEAPAMFVALQVIATFQPDLNSEIPPLAQVASMARQIAKGAIAKAQKHAERAPEGRQPNSLSELMADYFNRQP